VSDPSAVVSRMTKEFSAALIERCAGPAANAPERGPGAGTPAAAGPRRLRDRWRAWWTRLLHAPVRPSQGQSPQGQSPQTVQVKLADPDGPVESVPVSVTS
jgi:hypothetical protein